MQRAIARAFAEGALRPSSEIGAIKHVGPMLAEGLRRVFSPRARRLTIRVFARRIAPLDVPTLRSKLQHALQNRRANQCVDGYHVRDVNLQGWKACRALIATLARGRDAGHALGAAFRFDHRGLRNPPSRGTAAATVGCIRNPRACRAAGGTFSRRLCHPPAEQRGFEGVSPFAGQRLRRGQRPRGQYVATADGARWRRPGALAPL